MILDAISVHLIDTTASSGAKYEPTARGAVVKYIVENRKFRLAAHLHILEIRACIRRGYEALK